MKSIKRNSLCEGLHKPKDVKLLHFNKECIDCTLAGNPDCSVYLDSAGQGLKCYDALLLISEALPHHCLLCGRKKAIFQLREVPKHRCNTM